MGYKDIDKTMEFVKKQTLDLPFTIYGKEKKMQTLDYIFYNSEHMKTFRTLDAPDARKVARTIGYFPNHIFPSDHLSLCADFILT